MDKPEYVFIRKRGKMFYPFNVGYVCRKIPLQEAIDKGYKPSSHYIKKYGNIE